MASCKILVREPAGVSLLREDPPHAQPKSQPQSQSQAQFQGVPGLDKLACNFTRSSPDGSVLAVVSPADVALVDSATGAELSRFAAPNTVAVSFSPKGTFLLTFQKPDGQSRNLVLRNARDGSPLWQQFQKAFSKQDWPTLRFSDDEAVAYRVATNEVQFYEGAALLEGSAVGPTGRLKAQGLAAAALCPSQPSHVAAFFPSVKGAPASVRVYATSGVLGNCKAGDKAPLTEPPVVARRSFFKASSVRMLWGGGAKGVLVWTHSDVDKTNQSYYGDSGLHFLSTDSSFEGSVPLGKEGPIHDVQWAPSGKEFVVVHGFMPAKAILFDAKCKPLFDFGSGPRNMVRWSPHSRFIFLGGFGNLPGDMEFWDRDSLKLLGSNRASCGVTAEWAPHGRTLLVATTAPRLQVDNGLRLFKYNGVPLLHAPYQALYEAEWLPAPAGAFPDRPASPGAAAAVKAPTAAGAPAGAGKAAAPAPYRPPNASASAGATFRAKMSGEADKPRHLGQGATQLSSEPGKLSKSAMKNLKKKQNRAASSAAAGTPQESGEAPPTSREEGGGGPGATIDLASGDSLAKQVEKLGVTEHSQSAASSDAAADKEKKIRNLNKKLRQIEDLKQRDRSTLTVEQLEKLTQEASIREEVAMLQGDS